MDPLNGHERLFLHHGTKDVHGGTFRKGAGEVLRCLTRTLTELGRVAFELLQHSEQHVFP